MSMLHNRKVLTAGWAATVFGLFVLAGMPMTLSTGGLLLLVGTAPLVIVFALSRPTLTLSQRIAEARAPEEALLRGQRTP